MGKNQKNQTVNIGTHPRIDPDVVAATWIELIKQGKTLEEVNIMPFLTAGDEVVSMRLENLIVLDRGSTDRDHHINGRSEHGETSTSLTAKKCGVQDDPHIQSLVNEIQRNDLQGITQSFSFCHVIKAAQRNSTLTDQERMSIGLRVIDNAMEFRKRGLQRENLWVQSLLIKFIEEVEDKFIPEDFQRYIRSLSNLKFQRSFDFVEILVAEKTIRGEEEATRFLNVIARLIHRDGYNHYKAWAMVQRTPYKNLIGDIAIIANDPRDPTSKDKECMLRFSSAARRYAKIELDGRAAIVIQYSPEDGTQISFDMDARCRDGQYLIPTGLIEDIVAVLRLEECLIQDRQLRGLDLVTPNTIPEIPEWHFFCTHKLLKKTKPGTPPSFSNKRPGRFIFNRSLTAPDVPLSKISFETIFFLVGRAAYYQPLNWEKWVASRMGYYLKQKSTT